MATPPCNSSSKGFPLQKPRVTLYYYMYVLTSFFLQRMPGLMYAELGPQSQEQKIQRPPSGDNVGVQYSSVLHGEVATKTVVHPAGTASAF